MSGAVTPRMGRVLEAMGQAGLDTLLLTPSSSLKYVLGQSPIADERLFVLALSPGRRPFLLANSLYALEAEEMFSGDKVFWRDGEDPYPLLGRELERRGYPLSRLAVDQSTQARFLLPLMELLPLSRLCSAAPVLDALRVCKDPEERERLREACRRGDQALERVMARGGDWVGRTEAEFFARLSYEMTALGLEEPGACVCAGANAADPHHTAGQAVIRRGSCLLVDFGGTYRNYYTDMTRTFWFGEPDPEFQRVHEVVRRANAAARAAAVPGRALQEVDRAARRVIQEAGYGAFFVHRTGHGVGIDVHEGPGAAEGETAELKPGMAFSIEPGIYLPGRFGVRIEDLVLMGEDGAEVLHRYPRELICYP